MPTGPSYHTHVNTKKNIWCDLRHSDECHMSHVAEAPPNRGRNLSFPGLRSNQDVGGVLYAGPFSLHVH